ncbi:MAG: CBS domain-containing protein [candidate division Zixibacteria bacterium]|nr:CBS domain-containing protein [candidate division Zixibacteria bacterium]
MVSKRAGEIMIPLENYPHIPYWFTLRQAVAEMEKSEIKHKDKTSLPRSLLVFDEKYQLLGIVRRRDILRGLEPKFMKTMPASSRGQLFDVEIDPDLVELSAGKIAKAMQEQAEQQVSEVMQPIVSTADINDHVAKLVYKMVSRELNLIPVVNGSSIVGVVRSVDVFHEVANILL